MFTKGRTATECGGGEKVALVRAAEVVTEGAAAIPPVVGGAAESPCPRLHGLSISSQATATVTNAATITESERRNDTGLSATRGRRAISGASSADWRTPTVG